MKKILGSLMLFVCLGQSAFAGATVVCGGWGASASGDAVDLAVTALNAQIKSAIAEKGTFVSAPAISVSPGTVSSFFATACVTIVKQ